MENFGLIERAVIAWLLADGWQLEVQMGEAMFRRGDTYLNATSLAFAVAEALDGKR